MTVKEYLDSKLFPLSTQPGLTIYDQLKLDALNADEYDAAMKRHEQLTDEERAVGRELEAKRASRESVLRELNGGNDPEFPQGPDGRPIF